MEQDRVPGSCTGPGCVRPPRAEPLCVRHLAEPVAFSPSGAEAGRQVLLAGLPERLLHRRAGEHAEDRHGQVVRGDPCLSGRDQVAGPGFDSQAQHPRCRGAVPGSGPEVGAQPGTAMGRLTGQGEPGQDHRRPASRLPRSSREDSGMATGTEERGCHPSRHEVPDDRAGRRPELPVSLAGPAFEDAGGSGGEPCRMRVAAALPGAHQARKARLRHPPAGGAKRLSIQGDQVAPGRRRPGSRPRVIALELVTVLRSAGLNLQQGNRASLIAHDEVRVTRLAAKPYFPPDPCPPNRQAKRRQEWIRVERRQERDQVADPVLPGQQPLQGLAGSGGQLSWLRVLIHVPNVLPEPAEGLSVTAMYPSPRRYDSSGEDIGRVKPPCARPLVAE